jgi:hypothetical protein
LKADAAGVATYSGTEATFLQTLEHEIGHALGLMTDADPTSLEYYSLNESNRTVSAGDKAAINQVYRGRNDDVASRSQQLVQAMSTFSPGSAAITNIPPEQLRANSFQLARPALH